MESDPILEMPAKDSGIVELPSNIEDITAREIALMVHEISSRINVNDSLYHEVINDLFARSATSTDIKKNIEIIGLTSDDYKQKKELTEGEVLGTVDRYHSLDEYIDKWLKERGKMHISLLGPFSYRENMVLSTLCISTTKALFWRSNQRAVPFYYISKEFFKGYGSQQLINDALLEQYKLRFVGNYFDIFEDMNRHGNCY